MAREASWKVGEAPLPEVEDVKRRVLRIIMLPKASEGGTPIPRPRPCLPPATFLTMFSNKNSSWGSHCNYGLKARAIQRHEGG
jgi:hypothetical protein